jgi:hypothetical protein
MTIVNHIKATEKKKPVLGTGQVWLDTTTGVPYLLVGDVFGYYSLFSIGMGNQYHPRETCIDKVFGNDREDFVLVETELHIMRVV